MLKKKVSRTIALLLAFMLLIPNSVILAEDTDGEENVLFKVDEQMSYGWDNGIQQFAWKDAASGDTSTIMNWVSSSPVVSADGNTLEISQTKTSGYEFRVLTSDLSSVQLESDRTYQVAMRFKLKADSYDTVPFVKARLVVAGVYADMNTNIELTSAAEDTWHDLVYTLSPDTHSISATFDGNACYSGSYASSVTNLGTPQFQLVAQNVNGQNDKNTDLVTPITWSVDYVKVSATGDTPVQTAEPTAAPTAVPQTGDGSDIFSVDTQMTYAWNNATSDYAWTDGSTGDVSAVKNWVGATVNVSSDKEALVVRQTGNSGNNFRLLTSDLSSVPVSSTPYQIKMRFQLAADDYASVPYVKARLVAPGIWADMNTNISLTSESADTWHELIYTIDPTEGKVTATIDGVPCYNANLNTANTPNLGTPMFQLSAQNTASSTGENTESLVTPITWTIDYLKVTALGDEPVETTAPTVAPTAAPGPDGDVFSVDTQMTYAWNNATSDYAWSDGDSGSVSAVKNWVGASISVSSDNEALVVRQTKNSGYNFRLLTSDLSSYALNTTPYQVKLRFKLAADSYDTVPYVKARLVAAGVYAEMNTNVPITAAAADTWHDLVYTVNPVSGNISATIDGASCFSGNYNTTNNTNLGTPMFQLIAQNTASSSGEGSEDLTTPVTWTIDYYKVTGMGTAPIPTAAPKNDSLLIDENMVFSNATLSQPASVGSILHEYYNAGIDSAFSQKLIDNNSKFEVKQSLSSAYQQRLQVTDPQPVLLDKPITATIKFRVKADDYSKGTIAKMTFVYLTPGNNFLDMSTNIPLSADAENIDQTLVYVIDPAEGTIVGTLNGQQVASATFSKSLTQFDKIQFFPVVQPAGKSNTDREALGTTVTWTYDSFEIKRSIDSASDEPEEGTPLASAVSSGAWQSPLYANGVGSVEVDQLTGKILDLGKQSKFNKIVLDHDPSSVMSFSISASSDGLTYTPITNVYAGGVDEYDGRQVYYLPTVDARYVKYNTVLIKDAKTQGVLNNMTVSYTDVTGIDINVPDSIDPSEALEYKLSAVFTDEDGDTEKANSEGIVWTVSPSQAAEIYGSTLHLSPDVADGTITLTAADKAGNVSASKTVKIKTDVVVRNLGLYADAAMTQPLTAVTPGSTVYAKAEIFAKNGVADKNVMLAIGSYDDGQLASVAFANATATEEAAPVSTSVTVPATVSANGTVAAYIWIADTMRPLCTSVQFGNGKGATMQNVFLPMHGEQQLKSAAADVVWSSSDARIAAVDANGKVSAKSEGFAVVTAKKGTQTVGKVRVQVKPSTYVYLMIGQSNMSGTNNPVAEGVSVPISDNVKLLNKSNEFEQAQHPYRRYSGVNGIGTQYPYIGWTDATNAVGDQYGINMSYQFAEDMAAANPDTNIGLVVQSSSGSSILSYEKNAAEDENIKDVVNGFANTVERMQQALSGDAQFKGILWHQGESDSQDTTYPQRLRNLIYDFRMALDSPEVPLILGGLSETNRGVYVIHNARVKEELGRIPNMGFASSTEPAPLLTRAESTAYQNDSAIWHTDYTHISAVGQIEFGHRYYQTYLDVNGKQN